MPVKLISEAEVEKNLSKVLSGDAAAGGTAWLPPSMGDPAGSPDLKSGKLLTAEQMEQLQKQAYDEGFEQGKQKGFEFGHQEAKVAGAAQINDMLAKVEGIMSTLEVPLKQLDDRIESELVGLVISMVKQLVRREVRLDPSQIIGVVREALSILPVGSRSIRVILHPEDAKLIREVYDMSDNEQSWKVTEDPVLARGGCRVITETSQIDATTESRLANLIAPLMGGERDIDSADSQEDG